MNEASGALTPKTVQGIAFLVLGLAVFSLQDVIMKLFSSSIALQEVIFLRGVLMLAIIGVLIYQNGGRRAFVTQRLFLCLFRGLAGFLCFTTFSMALAVLPLADAMPLYYTSPLFVVLLAAPFLGERVGIKSLIAILVGFAGVILVARPSLRGVEPAMFLALVAAISYSAQSLLARKLGATESALTMTFYSQVAFVLLSGTTALVFGAGGLDQFDHPSFQYLFRAWTLPTPEQVFLIGLLGIIGTIGFLCISQAYRLGKASLVAPFEYSSLPYAVFWGWLFWGAIPGGLTIAGSLLIVAGGVYALNGELWRKETKMQSGERAQ
ncbi:DMT family transporter [Roseibium sp. HPY-6]|uniref:DMT family transporter n=1 Tax=Roseibium sp. HPY-6 TaxID=3229852 RepID=UPI00338F7638